MVVEFRKRVVTRRRGEPETVLVVVIVLKITTALPESVDVEVAFLNLVS